jgi:hypothetical protein
MKEMKIPKSTIESFTEKLILKIDQEKFFGCPGHGCIKPPQVLHIHHFIIQVTLIKENCLPLSALGFMAGKRIGEFYL